MGNNTANEIYDPTIRALLDAGVSESVIATVSDNLIERLQNEDWGTEEESLREFAEYPVIVRSFERRGVHLPASAYLPLGKEEFDALASYNISDESIKDIEPYIGDNDAYILTNASAYADEIRRLRRLCDEHGIAWD